MSQVWRRVRLRNSETAPLHASMRRAVEHRGLMAIAIGELGVANSTTVALAALERGWTVYAHTPSRGCRDRRLLGRRVPGGSGLEDTGNPQPTPDLAWRPPRHGDHHRRRGWRSSAASAVRNTAPPTSSCRPTSPRCSCRRRPSSAPRQPSVRRSRSSTRTRVLLASRRLTKSALPKHVRDSVTEPAAVMKAARDEVMHQTGADQIKAETITRFTRNQVVQLVLLVALVYVRTRSSVRSRPSPRS